MCLHTNKIFLLTNSYITIKGWRQLHKNIESDLPGSLIRWDSTFHTNLCIIQVNHLTSDSSEKSPQHTQQLTSEYAFGTITILLKLPPLTSWKQAQMTLIVFVCLKQQPSPHSLAQDDNITTPHPYKWKLTLFTSSDSTDHRQ